MSSVGERIKQARTNKSLTQEDLAVLLGISRTSVTNYEKNNVVPSVEVLLKMCEVLQTSIDYILRGVIYTNNGESDRVTEPPTTYGKIECSPELLEHFNREVEDLRKDKEKLFELLIKNS